MEQGANKHQALDQIKHQISCEVLAKYSVADIRKKSLENLSRWRAKGTWGPVYDEWESILHNDSDQELIAIMTEWTDKANRLRQSMPYVGMLNRD